MKKTVYVSAYLSRKYDKRVYDDLHKILEGQIIDIQNNSKNVWCRDYMPIKSGAGKYVQFKYRPLYMYDMQKYSGHFPLPEAIHRELNLDCEFSDILLDGGAIEVLGSKAIVSDQVFRDNKMRDNKMKTETEIFNEIKEKLDLKQLIVIPQYPYDFTGHVDGLVRFIDGNRVVVNDLKKELEESEKDKNHYRKKVIENWVYAFKSALISAGLQMEELSTSIPEKGSPNSGEGIYTNFLLLEDLIIMPSYDNSTDDSAAKRLCELYERPVKKVHATELSKEGGMINCITWTK